MRASSRRTQRFPALLVFLIALSALALSGCDKAARSVAPSTSPSFADSPENAVRVLESAFANRNTDGLDRLLTDDFAYVLPVTSPTQPPEVWDRGRLLNSIQVLFYGDPTGTPAASEVALAFDRSLRATADPRPGHTFAAHRTIRTSVDLRVVHADQGMSQATGYVQFFLTRGDSALVPPELMSRDPGAHSSGRWWITRIEDETLPGAALSPNPAQPATLSEILRRYWNPR